MSYLVSSSIAPVLPEIPPVPAQVPTISSQLAVVEAQFASIPPDFTMVGAKLRPWGSFTSVFAILPHIRSQLMTVLPYLTPVTPNLSSVCSNLYPIRAQLTTFPGRKPAAILPLGKNSRRKSWKQSGCCYQHTTQKCDSHSCLLHRSSLDSFTARPDRAGIRPATTEVMEERQTPPMQPANGLAGGINLFAPVNPLLDS